MKSSKPRFSDLLNAALVVLGAAILTAFLASGTLAIQSNGSQKQNVRPSAPQALSSPSEEGEKSVEQASFAYEFTQPQFHIRHIVIEHDALGTGKITFERLHEEVAIVEPVALSKAALTRISSLWETARFLESDTNYQSDKQFPHLGTIRLKMARGERNRIAEFNWTNNATVAALVAEYRRVADQAIFIFDISVARANQPLNAPKLLERLELLMRRDGISDPEQLVPLLRDLSTDEHIPLIARHHADRLLKKIKK